MGKLIKKNNIKTNSKIDGIEFQQLYKGAL